LPNNFPNKEIAIQYKNDFEKAYNTKVSSFGGHAYDGLFAIVEAIKATGSTNPKKIRDGIENLKNFEGVDGIVNMSKSDHLGLDTKSGMMMLEIRNGDWTIVKD
jgi:branched-chain amino acid transport system substrate-binding protein